MMDYEIVDPEKLSEPAKARLEKYGHTLDAANVKLVIDRIADYPEIIWAVKNLESGGEESLGIVCPHGNVVVPKTLAPCYCLLIKGVLYQREYDV